MESIFADILGIDSVEGLLFISMDGKVLFKSHGETVKKDPEAINWVPFIQSIGQIKEADLLFQKSRIYIRQAYGGSIIVIMANDVQATMVRLNCDLAMPALKKHLNQKEKPGSTLSRLFRR
ncbi:MAG: hypothetical protein ACOC24_03425 [Desulfovibrionales bacterium]